MELCGIQDLLFHSQQNLTAKTPYLLPRDGGEQQNNKRTKCHSYATTNLVYILFCPAIIKHQGPV